MKKIKEFILYSVLLLVLGILLIMGLAAYIQKETSPYIYNNIKDIPPAQTVIVLGASVHANGKLSPVLQDRVDTALELFKSGKISKFLLSGDHRTDDYDEVNAMRNYLLERKVPEARIFLDHAGLNTYDSMYRSKEIFEVENAIIVTQNFHLPRAIFIARNLGLNYIGLQADAREYSTKYELARREQLANIKAVWELIINKEPDNLGKKIPISGNAIHSK